MIFYALWKHKYMLRKLTFHQTVVFRLQHQKQKLLVQLGSVNLDRKFNFVLSSFPELF